MAEKYIKCPDCGGSGVKECGLNGYYLACESCHGEGILEEKTMDLENVTDAINPNHYKNSTSLECIEAMEIVFGIDSVISFCCCNAWKYIWRWKNKNGAEDLEKAKWYVDKAKELIDRCDAEESCVIIGYNRTLKEIKNYIHRQQEKKVCEEV